MILLFFMLFTCQFDLKSLVAISLTPLEKTFFFKEKYKR